MPPSIPLSVLLAIFVATLVLRFATQGFPR